ncbi:OpgC domain-containing protein [soil metagenome]
MNGRRQRDPRLDFFRGVAMVIIVIAHTPENPWTRWIPARFGFSDATEIFVFCSGMASAIAFGSVFALSGWMLGTVRVLHRIWQVYWAHIGTFIVVAALMVVLNAAELTERNYVGQLNLVPFFRDPMPNLVGLVTLAYVPNYFDILPMYIVVLAMIPAVLALADLHRGLAALAVVTLWLAANFGEIAMPAEPWSDRRWFFNPFGWQFLFFTGFAFMAGWLRPPPVHPLLVAAALSIVLLTIPVAHFRIRSLLPELGELWSSLRPLAAKTPFGPLRLLHFLALAYLVWIAAGPEGARLSRGTWWPRVVAVFMLIGRQSLAVFVAGLVLSRLLGVALDLVGRDFAAAAAINLAGVASVIAVAAVVTWIKGEPWSAARSTAAPARRTTPIPEKLAAERCSLIR